MTKYEWFRWFTFPLMPTHLNVVRNDLKALVANYTKTKPLQLLDVGGRKSPYTINLKASITLLDVPQESDTQQQLHLGFTNEILANYKMKRSNIEDLILMDMTQSTLKTSSYDGVICIEVIEHVEADQLFVKHISDVIKLGGFAYFTTPNGDYIKNEGPNKNPDHVRHYTKKELQALLEKYFDTVEVYYAVATGKFRVWGLQSFKVVRPLRLLIAVVGNLINRVQSIGVSKRPVKTGHLIAKCYKNNT